MADSTINGLSSGSTPLAGTEEVPIWQSSATVKVTVQDIADLASGSNIGNSDLTISASGTRKLILGGALSTDNFTIRNSADTVDLLKVDGTGTVISRASADTNKYFYWNAAGTLELKNGTGSSATLITNNFAENGINGATALRLRTSNKGIYIWNSGNFYVGNATGIQAGNGEGNILYKNATTAPTTNVTDHHYYYSADESAGNACPHFRTENGSVVKLYQEAALTAADATATDGTIGTNDTITNNLRTRLNELETALQNLGLLA